MIHLSIMLDGIKRNTYSLEVVLGDRATQDNIATLERPYYVTNSSDNKTFTLGILVQYIKKQWKKGYSNYLNHLYYARAEIMTKLPKLLSLIIAMTLGKLFIFLSFFFSSFF